jgi:hypothetical protein
MASSTVFARCITLIGKSDQTDRLYELRDNRDIHSRNGLKPGFLFLLPLSMAIALTSLAAGFANF